MALLVLTKDIHCILVVDHCWLRAFYWANRTCHPYHWSLTRCYLELGIVNLINRDELI